MRRSMIGRVLATGLAISLATYPALAVAERATARRVALPGHIPAVQSAAKPVTPATASLMGAGASTDPDQSLTLTIVLQRTRQSAFADYLDRIYNRTSGDYLRFLSPVEVSDHFGPSQADYDAARGYFTERGFTVVADSLNRVTLTVSGTRAQVEAALEVSIRDYMLGERQFFAIDKEPTLPADLAPRVLAVTGLSNLASPQPQPLILRWIRIGIGIVICDLTYAAVYVGLLAAVANGLNGQPMTPAQLAGIGKKAQEFLDKCVKNAVFAAYNLPVGTDPPAPAWQGTDGTGQTIGLLAFDTFNRSDVADFIHMIGMPADTLDRIRQISVNGGAGRVPGPDQAEVLLDINAVLLLAPGAEIEVYDGPFNGANVSFQAIFNAMINGGVDIISNSWAYCEDQTSLADVQSIDSILQAAAASGISVFNAAGDTGSTCLNGSPNTAAVPASSPSATAVGGSSVTLAPGMFYGSETWWNGTADVPPTGQGGFGLSRFFNRPSYQDGFTAAAMRSVPDVVVHADPASGIQICMAADGGCPTGALYGGTSLSAPVWGAFTALLNQSQGTNLGALNPHLYALAGTDALHDAASMGTDFAHVGLGSPSLPNVHRRLTGQTAGPVDPTVSEVRLYLDGFAPWPSGGPLGMPVAADGAAAATVAVRLADNFGNPVAGKAVSLSASPGSSAVISPASAVTQADAGGAVFTVTNLIAESVTLTATDATDGVVLPKTVDVLFVVPPAAGGGIGASPTVVTADGTSTTTITVTLQDGLGRPASGKEVRLSQNAGAHSHISGPAPAFTDSNGQIAFTATNTYNETVTYAAVDVTDGDLSVPGSASVTFGSGAGTACTALPPTAGQGYVVTPFATGFAAANFFFGGINFGGCQGGIGMAFDGAGNLYAADIVNGNVYRFGPAGGVAGPATLVSNVLGPGVTGLTFGADGKLYAARAGNPNRDIVEIDPTTGALLRDDVGSTTLCAFGLATDPLSGDLFVSDYCFTGGNREIRRVSNPGSATPTTSVYVTTTTDTNGQIAFAPDGTMFLRSGPNILRVSGTDQPSPAFSIVPVSNPSPWGNLGMAIGASAPDGSALSLIGGVGPDPAFGNDPAGITAAFDLGGNPATVSAHLINGQALGNAIGPDGCLYVSGQDTVYRVTNFDGHCAPLAARRDAPSLTLTPTSVAPNPVQGSPQTFTAALHYASVPEGTPVQFVVGGANSRMHIGHVDTNGAATMTYAGTFTGDDFVMANIKLGDEVVVSNRARVSWGPGAHASFISLNTSPTGAVAGATVTLEAALFDVSAGGPLTGVQVEFSLAGQVCTATTDALGVARCDLVLPDAGNFTLRVRFLGSGPHLPATDERGFFVAAPPGPVPVACFTGPLPAGGTATACLFDNSPLCTFAADPAFIPVSVVGAPPPTGLDIPFGLFQFTAEGCGESTTLQLIYPDVLPEGTRYWAYGPTVGQEAHWYSLPAVTNGNEMSVALSADRTNGDGITAAGGAGILTVQATPVPVLDAKWLVPLAASLVALGVALLRRRRVRHSVGR